MYEIVLLCEAASVPERKKRKRNMTHFAGTYCSREGEPGDNHGEAPGAPQVSPLS